MKSGATDGIEVDDRVCEDESVICPFSEEKHKKLGNCLVAMICIVPVMMVLLLVLSTL
jgi:hypothetical protein